MVTSPQFPGPCAGTGVAFRLPQPQVLEVAVPRQSKNRLTATGCMRAAAGRCRKGLFFGELPMSVSEVLRDSSARTAGLAGAGYRTGSSTSLRRRPELMLLKAAGDYSGPARDIADLCRAYRLVYTRYVAEGYMRPRACKMRYSIFNLLPVSHTYVSCRNGDVVATATVVLDSPLGLPMGQLFEPEVELLRRAGRRVVEGTMLCAYDGLGFERSLLDVMMGFIGCCLSLRVDDICLVVNPKHVSFWQSCMGFEVFSEEKPCAHVRQAPGVLLRADVQSAVSGERKMPGLFRRLLRSAWSMAIEMPPAYQPSPAEAAEMLGLSPHLFTDATPLQRHALSELEPRSIVDRMEQRALSA